MPDNTASVIERNSPTPYYDQLFVILSERIASGTIPVGEKLASEHELCEEFGLSRATVRQALSKLENEGLAERIPRRGVFAAAPGTASSWVVQDAEGFLDSQVRHGRKGVTTAVVNARFIEAPDRVRKALDVADNKVFAIERVRSLDGSRALFSTNWIPGAAGRLISDASAVLSGESSLKSALADAGFEIVRARRTIHGLGAPGYVARHLGIQEGHPLLRIDSTSWTRGDRAVDYYETWVLTDTVPLEINISNS